MATSWKAIKLDAFVLVAEKEQRSPDHVEVWLGRCALDPIQLPVDQVVFASVDGQRKKCPAATLRGKVAPRSEAERASGWEVFLAYTPGLAENFATPTMKFTLAVGQTVSCSPPLLVADREQAKIVAAPKVEVAATLLGIVTGNEVWKATSKSSGEQKPKTELRRFSVVEIGDIVYFASFQQLGCKHDPARDYTIDVRECVRKAYKAGMERKPGSVHSSLDSALKKAQRARAIASAQQ
eukprot:6212585-Pleurochrysis_carterae.AAC.1